MFSIGYSQWPTFQCAYVNKIIPSQYVWSPPSAHSPSRCLCPCVCVRERVCFCHPCFPFVCFVCTFTLKRDARRKKERKKKKNQSGSSLGPVAKVIPRFYQWAKVPVAMETLMNERGPGNRGDGVNEELPHRPDTVRDGRCCSESEMSSRYHHHRWQRRLCYHHHHLHRQC